MLLNEILGSVDRLAAALDRLLNDAGGHSLNSLSY